MREHEVTVGEVRGFGSAVRSQNPEKRRQWLVVALVEEELGDPVAPGSPTIHWPSMQIERPWCRNVVDVLSPFAKQTRIRGIANRSESDFHEARMAFQQPARFLPGRTHHNPIARWLFPFPGTLVPTIPQVRP